MTYELGLIIRLTDIIRPNSPKVVHFFVIFEVLKWI